MRRRIAVILAGLAAAALCRGAVADEASLLHALVGSDNEARGDFDAWLVELCEAVAADPESPYALACVTKIDALSGSATDPTVIERTMGPVATRGVRDPVTEEAIRDLLVARARASGKDTAAVAALANQGYLRRFAVIGPFGADNGVLVHRPFGPESRDLDPTAPQEGARGEVRWQLMPAAHDFKGVDPTDQIRQGGRGVVYAMAHVRCGRARDVALRMWCGSSFRVFVNGAEVATANRVHDDLPTFVWATARFEEGWNRVLVKLVGTGSFGLKIADPETGKAVQELEEGDPLATEVFRGDVAPAGARTYRTPWERVADLSGGSAAALAGRAILAEHDRREWKAAGLWERAAAAVAAGPSTESANVRAGYGRFLAGFEEMPAVHRKVEARRQFELALEHFPDHNSAAMRIAQYDDEDDKPADAVNALRKYMERNPTALAAMTLARIAGKRGWEKESLDAAQTALSLSPNMVEAIDFLAAHDRRYGNQEAVLKAIRRKLAIDASDSRSAGELVRALRDLGRDAEALEVLDGMLRIYPNASQTRAQRAEILRALDRLDESVAAWRGLEQLVPQDDRWPREIGEILEIRGDTAGALASYQRSLELEPFQPRVWKAVARLGGEDRDLGLGWEPDTDELLANLPSDDDLRKAHPKAVAITVLDHTVTRVHEDGSSTSWVHMIYKILDEKGVAKYGDVRRSGELLEIRTVLPDGTVMLPTGLGRSSFNLEGLVPGAIVDHRFVAHQGRSPNGYDGGKFYFQDYDLGSNPNPVLLSRLVVLSPEGMKLDPTARNFGSDGPRTEQVDGLTATVWEKRDMPRIEQERFMPDTDEILPHADYTVPDDMEDANWVYLSDGAGTWPTPVLEKVVKAAIPQGATDLEKLRALHTWVNTEIKGDSGAGRTPSSTVMEHAGDRKELFEALVRTAGIPHLPARAMAWNGEGQDLLHPGTSAFTARFLWLMPRDAEPVAYFEGARHTPFGLVPEPFRGSAAFIADRDGGRIVELPHGGVDVQDTESFALHLGDSPSQVRVAGTLTLRNPGAYRWKRQIIELDHDNRTKWLEGQFSRYFANPTLAAQEFPGLEEFGRPLVIRMEGTMSTYLVAQGAEYVASLGLPAIDMTGRYVHRPEREYDLALNVHEDDLAEVTIHLGDRFRVKRLPHDHITVNDLGTYSLTFRDRGDRVEIRREHHFRPARYRPDEYPRFVSWCKAIDEAEGRKLTFTARP